MISPLTSCTGAPLRATAATRSACLAAAAPVTNNSVIKLEAAPLWPRASLTACGPSARNCRDRSRNARLPSARAARTLGDRVAVIAAIYAAARGASTSAGSALRATSTSAVNAAGSATAISASILRSTSTPAAFRPWMNLL